MKRATCIAAPERTESKVFADGKVEKVCIDIIEHGTFRTYAGHF